MEHGLETAIPGIELSEPTLSEGRNTHLDCLGVFSKPGASLLCGEVYLRYVCDTKL